MFDEEENPFFGFQKVAEATKRSVENKEKLKEVVEKAKEELGVKTDEELLEVLPDQKKSEHGAIELVGYNGVALTDQGKLTKTHFFNSLKLSRDIYKDMALTQSESQGLIAAFRTLSTGTNSVLPMKCTGPSCPFAEQCPYMQINKAPIGLACPVELELLLYHTERFMKEFDVDPEEHSELMLVQELAELIVYEMRITRILSKEENAMLKFDEIMYTPDGDMMTTTKIHWAWELKEKIKNRRFKLLDLMMGTRKSKKANIHAPISNPFFQQNKELLDKIEMLSKNFIQNADYKEV